MQHRYLENQNYMARRLKRLKAQKDRLLDALRDLVEATDEIVVTPNIQKALDKAQRALDLDEYASH